MNPAKLREVLLHLTNAIDAKANVDETVLYKLLHFIDVDFFEKYGRSVTGLSRVRLPRGPLPTGRTSQWREAVAYDQTWRNTCRLGKVALRGSIAQSVRALP
ncbi:MAG: SocA family protein [Propionibacteriaceae bacterium]|nr:SocA family protein [Propionibacteriaceae bacterium]